MPITMFKIRFNYRNFLLILGILLSSIFFVTSSSYAEDDEDYSTTNQILIDSASEENYGMFKDGSKNYYNIDYVTEADAKKARSSSIWEDLKEHIFGFTDFSGNFEEKFRSMLETIINFYMKMNIFFANILIIVLDFASGFDVIEGIINEANVFIGNLTGIDGNGNIQQGVGLFGTFLNVVLASVVIYAVYVLLFKRAILSSLSHIGKTIISITLAMIIFSNFSTYIIGANKISNDVTEAILTSVESGSQTGTINDTIWALFVDRPYLTLQYGTYKVDEIGRERIESLLKTPTGEERTKKVLIDEVAGENNDLMVTSSVLDRLAFSQIYILVNLVMSIPLFVLAITLIVVQFWYIAIALIAPFAFIVAAMPECFGVMKRYLIELILPLAIKIFLAVITTFVLMLSNILYALDTNQYSNNSFAGYIAAMVVQGILFLVIFLMRKRIMNIFTSGSQWLAGMRTELGKPTEFLKKGIVNTSTAIGATVGAFTAGAVGAQIGAGIGGTLGKLAIGEKGVTDAALDTSKALAYGSMLKKSKGDSLNKLQYKVSDEEKDNYKNFLLDKGFDEVTASQLAGNFASEVEGRYLEEVSEEELSQAYDGLVETYGYDGKTLDGDLSTKLASSIAENRFKAGFAKQQDVLRQSQEIPTRDSVKAVYGEDSHTAKHLANDLVENGIYELTTEETNAIYQELSSKYKEGMEGSEAYREEFVEMAKALRKDDARSLTSRNVSSFFVGHNDPQLTQSVVQALESKGIYDVKDSELGKHFDELKLKYENGEITKGKFANNLANAIYKEREASEEKETYRQAFDTMNIPKIESVLEVTDVLPRFFESKWQSPQAAIVANATMSELQKEGIAQVTEKELEIAYAQVQSQGIASPTPKAFAEAYTQTIRLHRKAKATDSVTSVDVDGATQPIQQTVEATTVVKPRLVSNDNNPFADLGTVKTKTVKFDTEHEVVIKRVFDTVSTQLQSVGINDVTEEEVGKVILQVKPSNIDASQMESLSFTSEVSNAILKNRNSINNLGSVFNQNNNVTQPNVEPVNVQSETQNTWGDSNE